MIKNIVLTIQFIVIVILTWVLFNKPANSISEQVVTSGDNALNQTIIANPYKDANLSFEFVASENNTWGYKILIEGSVIIVQPNKPGLPGNEGFKTKEKAQKTAELVIYKIRNGEMPPTITLVEMKNLNAL